MLLLILASAVFAATATLVEKPQNTFASERHRVELNCSTSDMTTPISWQYIPGAEGDLPKDVFLGGRLVNDYVRFQMYGNSAEGVYNLVIPSVELRDAGTYRCRDQDGAGEYADVILNVTTNAEFSLVPLFTEAVVGESAYFDCTTTTHTNEVQWHYYRVGAKDHEDICLYCMSKKHPQYENRIEVLRNSSINTYRLRINSVQLEDAGSYICQGNGGIGDSLSAQLIILASAPICQTNMKPDGLIGPNSCNIEPEGLQMSCNVVYHGNIKPMLQWREIRSLNSIKEGLNCSQTGFKVTCDVALKASFDLHGSSYVCETTTSSTSRYNCSAGVVRIIHSFGSEESKRSNTHIGDRVECTANSSQSCSYKWVWYEKVGNDLSRTIESTDNVLLAKKIGLHRCEAQCDLRNQKCLVFPKFIDVIQSEKSPEYSALHSNPEPRINEVLIGESAYFDCTPTTHTSDVLWFHYRVGAKDHEDVCLYCSRKVNPIYENKIELRKIGTDTYRLWIKSVQLEDAGKYICKGNGDTSDYLSADLVVLESSPICHTTIESDGLLLGPNSCNMEPDELQVSCNVSYNGDSTPIIQWRAITSADPITRGVSCRQTDNTVTCNLALEASFALHGTSYVCETTTPETTRHNCTSGVISLISVNTNNKVTEMALGSKQTVICFANSSQSCSHTWKWLNGEQEEVVTNSAALTPSKAGLYKCESECSIRGKQCMVLSGLVYVSEQTTQYLSNEWGMCDRILTALIVVIVLFVLGCTTVCIIVRRSRRNPSKFPKGKNIREQQ